MTNNYDHVLSAKTHKEFLDRFTYWQADESQPETIYGFFCPMKLKTAKAFLSRFIEAEREDVEEIRADIEAAGLQMDYSLDTLPQILKWMMLGVKPIRVPPPDTWTDWLKDSFKEGLLLINEQSKLMFLRAAFYLGESFVRSRPSLRWATGTRIMRNLMANMPVVVGFTHDELPPLIWTSRVFLDILDKGEPDTLIDKAVDKLIRHIP